MTGRPSCGATWRSPRGPGLTCRWTGTPRWRSSSGSPISTPSSGSPPPPRPPQGGDGQIAPPGVRGALELSAHMTVRPGQLEGFRRQAAECIWLTREKDTATLRYDWFLSSDGIRCEVREAYTGEQGLIEHRANVAPTLQALFGQYAGDHAMTVYRQPSCQLHDLAEAHHMTGHITWFCFLEGLEEAPPPVTQASGRATPETGTRSAGPAS